MDESAPFPHPVATQAAPLSRRRFVTAATAATAAGALAACSPSRRPPPTTAGRASTTTSVTRSIRIGYVAEFTGPNSFRGEFVKASMDALTGYLDDKRGGTYKGLTLELLPADAPSATDGRSAYEGLVKRQCVAVLWCSPFGLAELLPVVQSGTVPVISVMSDLYSAAQTPPVLTGGGSTGSMLFQTAMPESFAFDVMMAYASEDRGFSSAGLVFDTAQYPRAGALFTAAAAKHGLSNRGVFAYDSASSHVDLATPLSALKQAGCHVVVCYGLADQASALATHLQLLDAKYVDTPTTRASKFKPMLMGAPWGVGDPSFTRLAGDAAARGSLSATSMSGVLSLPTLPIRGWLHDYVQGYNAGFLRGGEAAPADAVVAVVDAAARAGSTRGGDLIAALEHGQPDPVVSGIGVSFAPDRHLGPSKDDVVLTTLEWPPTAYTLGAEWRDVLPGGYQGPTQLVDFTLAANTRAHPSVMQEILTKRFGTSCSDDYQGGDPSRVAACKAVH